MEPSSTVTQQQLLLIPIRIVRQTHSAQLAVVTRNFFYEFAAWNTIPSEINASTIRIDAGLRKTPEENYWGAFFPPAYTQNYSTLFFSHFLLFHSCTTRFFRCSFPAEGLPEIFDESGSSFEEMKARIHSRAGRAKHFQNCKEDFEKCNLLTSQKDGQLRSPPSRLKFPRFQVNALKYFPVLPLV